MQIGIISDTHGHVENARLAARMLESLEVETVLHCGDIGTPEIISMFEAWQMHYVFGNCDHDHRLLEAFIQETYNATCHGLFGELELDGVKIALLHSHEEHRFAHALDSGDYNLVCYGHTHVAAKDLHGSTLALNPGAIYRAEPLSIAVVDLPTMEATIVPLSF